LDLCRIANARRPDPDDLLRDDLGVVAINQVQRFQGMAVSSG
jgi:hypothetical protein